MFLVPLFIPGHEAAAPLLAEEGGCYRDGPRGIEDVHHPETGLLCLESAHSSGAVQPLDNLRAVIDVAHQHQVPVHLDGARIFNAAEALGITAAEVAQGADSVMYCLSKGLGAPIGSLLCGSRELIARARRNRKSLGGGMRQVGFLGAAGLHALEHHVARLAEDHARADRLAAALSEVDSITICEDRLQINMVWFKHEFDGDPLRLVDKMRECQVKIFRPLGGEWRLVTHLDVDDEALDYAIEQLRDVFGNASRKGTP